MQTPKKSTLFSGQYLHNRSTLDIGVLGYIGIVWPKEHSPEVWSIPPVTPCIYIYIKIMFKHYQILIKWKYWERWNSSWWKYRPGWWSMQQTAQWTTHNWSQLSGRRSDDRELGTRDVAVCQRLVQIGIFFLLGLFLNKYVVLVKEVTVIIFQDVHLFPPVCTM